MKISNMARAVLKKKRVFLMLLLVAVGFVFFAHGVLAQTAPTVTECSFLNFSCFIDKFFYGILWFLALILSYVAMITNWAMQPAPITTSFFVQAGWKATRDFANMFFILILLGIALDFILFNSFGVKRALPKLLLIALLINFSIPIAGIFIDFANIVSSFFLNQVSGSGFTEAIAQSVGLAKVFDANNIGVTATTIDGVRDIATTANNSFLNVLFSIGLLTGMIFIFAALAVMFLFRTGILSVLLILLPIVLVLYAFPPSSRHFGKWMSKFTQWTMFAPTAAFFLYLSMLLLIQTGNNGILSMGGTTTITEGSFAYTLLRYVMVWMLMLMSLVVAQNMGITGASTAMAMWKTGTKWARGKASQAGKTMATAAGRKIKADEQLESLAKGLRTVPGLGGMLESGVRSLSEKTKMAMEKQEGLTSQQKAQYEKSPDEQLRREYAIAAESKLPGSGAKAAQIAEILARRGKLNVLNEDGTMNTEGTTAMVKEAYNFAKQHKYKAISESIMKANPVVYQEIVQKEWEDLASKDKLSEMAYDIETRQLIKGRKKDTGEILEDAKNKAFEKMGATDFEGLKGAWDEKAVRSFLLSGAMGSNHIRMASYANDHVFINHLTSILSELSSGEINSLKQKSPSLVSFLTGGKVKEFVKVPVSFEDKVNENEEKKRGGE